MKKIAAIFAHPDDEAFGPSGTIALLAQKNEVYLICVTDGSAGNNSLEEDRSLIEIRKEEIQKSAAVLGVKEVIFLGYQDGALCNNLYHLIADDLEMWIKQIKPETILTFEHRGFLGHIDHIAVSMISSFIFEKLTYIKSIMYYCITEEHRKLQQPYFIYIPPGFSKSDISLTYDITTVWDKKLKSMQQHKSQNHDYIRYLQILTQLPKEEHFLVFKKEESQLINTL